MDFKLTFLVFSGCIITMALPIFPFVLILYLTLSVVFSDYGMIPFGRSEVVIYIQYVYIRTVGG